MNGVIQQGIQAQEPVAPEPEEATAETPEGDDYTPEEQDAIDRVVTAAGQVIYKDDKSHGSIMNMLKSGKDDPAQTLAQVTATIILQLDEKAGGNIPEEVILPASLEILTLVAELAEKSGAFTAGEDVQGQAVGGMLQIFQDKDLISDEDKAELQQILAEHQGAQEQTQPGA